MVPYTCLSCGSLAEMRYSSTLKVTPCPSCGADITPEQVAAQICVHLCTECAEPVTFQQSNAAAIVGRACRHCGRVALSHDLHDSIQTFHKLLSRLAGGIHHLTHEVQMEYVNGWLSRILSATATERRRAFKGDGDGE